MAIVYDRNEEAAIKCDDCGAKRPMRYGKQTAPLGEQIRTWDDDTDLCPGCFLKHEERHQARIKSVLERRKLEES